MYCRKCGKEIPEDSVFCPYCKEKTDASGSGKKLSKSAITLLIASVVVVAAVIVLVIVLVSGKNADNKNNTVSSPSETQTIQQTQETITTQPSTTSTTSTTVSTTKTTAAKKKLTCYGNTDIPDYGAYFGKTPTIYHPYDENGMVMYETTSDCMNQYSKLLAQNGYYLQSETDGFYLYSASAEKNVKLYSYESENGVTVFKIISPQLFDYAAKNYNYSDMGI